MLRLTSSEIKALKAVHQGLKSPSQLRSELDLSDSQISALTGRLERKGFLAKRRKGASMILELTVYDFNEPLKRLFSRNLQFDKLLSGSAGLILTVLVMPSMAGRESIGCGLRVKHIQLYSGCSRGTVASTLKRLMQAGAVYLDGGCYRLSRGLRELEEFVHQYALYQGSAVLQNLVQATDDELERSNHIQVLKHYQAGGEILFSVPQEVVLGDDTHVTTTSFTAFRREDLEFRTTRDYYHYSMGGRPIRKEDVALDHLLLDPHSFQNTAYSMMYLLKSAEEVDREYLVDTARMFGVDHIVREMLRYLEHVRDDAYARSRPFPSKPEFRDLCVLYGVRY